MDNLTLFWTIHSLSGKIFFLDQLMYFSAVYLLWIILLFLLIQALYGEAKEKKMFILVSIAVFFSNLIASLIQILTASLRPFTLFDFIPLIPPPAGFSFPSGHAAMSAALGTIVYLFKPRWWAIIVITPLLIGFSRIYTGVHYPLDVLGGFILGIIIAFLIHILTKYFFKR